MNLQDFLANEAYRARFTNRLQKEISDTTNANFALDVAGDMLVEEIKGRDETIKTLSQEKNDLVARTTNDVELVKGLRAELDASRTEARDLRDRLEKAQEEIRARRESDAAKVAAPRRKRAA